MGIAYLEAINVFEVESSDLLKSLNRVIIPASFGSNVVKIEVDVIEYDIPLLLSKEALERAHACINIKDDSVKLFGEKINFIVLSSGHFSVPLSKTVKLLKDIDHNRYIRISLQLQSINPEDKSEIASRLHSKFAHAPANKMIKLLNSAGLGEDSRLVSEVYRVSQACEICAQLPFVQTRHAFESVLATEFIDVNTFTLMDFGGQKVLHLMYLTTRFIPTCVPDSIAPNEVVDFFLEI